MKEKPTPSTIASLIIFILTGIYTIIVFKNNFFSELPILIKVFLFLAVFFNALYYYLTEIDTELDKKFQEKLEKVHKSEWYIRVFNQIVLFSLWFLLQNDTIFFFAMGLILLFLSYLIWDFVAYSCFENNKLLVFDIIGFIFTIIFILLGYAQFYAKVKPGALDTSRDFSWTFIWGASVFVYMMIPLIAILFKYPPKFLVRFIEKKIPVAS